MITRKTLTPLVLYLPWVPKSPNQCGGVKAKIAEWKRTRKAWDTALQLSPAAQSWLMDMIRSHSPIRHLLTESPNGSDSTTTPTQDSNGTTTKS